MRLWTIDHAEWQKTAPFVDTLVLPVCPVELREKRLFLDQAKWTELLANSLENRLAGRVLLLPPVYYVPGSADVWKSYLEAIIKDMKQSGFDHLVVVGAGLPEQPVLEIEQETVTVAWHPLNPETANRPKGQEEELDLLYNRILELWQSRH